jgi:glycosyltransferase involved in cell wall biosynthesis
MTQHSKLGTRPSLVYLASVDFPHVKARTIQVVNTCHALSRAGCAVTLVVGRRGPGPPDEHLAHYGLEPNCNLRIIGLPTIRLPARAPSWLSSYYTRLWNWSYLAACLMLLPRLIINRQTTVLARDYRLAWLVLKLRHWHRWQLAFEVHGLPSDELLDSAQPSPSARREAARLRKLEQAVFDSAWRLLPITECLHQRLIRERAVGPQRVFTIPDASAGPVPDDGRVTTGSPPPAASFPSPPTDGPARLIYVGQLYPWKGVDLLLRALADVPGVELTIVGGLPHDPERVRLERLAVVQGVADRCIFAGPQPYRFVPRLLASADIALLPLAEGLVARCFTSPLKLFDYLAAGLPIVAVDFPTIREVLRDGENGLLVAPNDHAAMAAAIKRLLADPELAGSLATQARRDAAEYTWDKRAERILGALGQATRHQESARARLG